MESVIYEQFHCRPVRFVTAIVSVLTLLTLLGTEAKTFSLDYDTIESTIDTVPNSDGGIKLTVKHRFYLFNSGKEPLRVTEIHFSPQTFDLKVACFDQGLVKSTTQIPVTYAPEVVLAPKQLIVLETSAQYDRAWRPGMKDAAMCYEFGNLSALAWTRYGIAALKFEPTKIVFLKGEEPTLETASYVAGESPTIFSDATPEAHSWPVVVDDDVIKELIVRDPGVKQDLLERIPANRTRRV